MSFHASTNTQSFEDGLWCALTRLDGFEFPLEPPLTGRELKQFEKATIGKASWRQLTQEDLVARVAAIFTAACNVYESKNDPVSNSSFYFSVAKKASKNKPKDYNIFRQVIGVYVDGLKIAATRSDNHIYVNRRSAPAALSVASWIELTEGKIITITTKNSTKNSTKAQDGTLTQRQSRKRYTEVLEGECGDGGAEARRTHSNNAILERDKAVRELEEAKIQIRSLTQEAESAKLNCNTQAVQLRNVKRETKRKTSEWRRAEAKRDRFLKALRTSQRQREEVIFNIKREYDNRVSEYFASAEAQWRDAVRDLTLAKQERDQYQRALADCADVIKSLNSKLNGEHGGA
ncbi:hypothetical protein GQX73_g1643 [Xylaria multiplex]|uniref:Uncharacterized protein n=1 Tax=Xylaria multiplex TaxID=323545 RepID=A0A7C8MZ44_9PEZI|nr:hypothetical protein GQX73_g1643 [Xylaria multiplex]